MNAKNTKLYLLGSLLIIGPVLSATPVHFPFPQHATYPFGIRPNTQSQEVMDNDCEKAYKAWIKDWVTDDGCPAGASRVHVGNDTGGFLSPYDTVSEGIAWGMLITVFMDNKVLNTKRHFDSFNKYRKFYLDSNGLMKWRIDRTGKVIGEAGATEADENAAMALLFAHYQWGSTPENNYLQEATDLINAIMDHEVEKPSFVLKPGDTWGGSTVLNPCYFSPAYYRIWKDVTGDSNWIQVVDTSYKILEYFHDTNPTGFPPEWCKADGSPSPGYEYHYGYNACQVPLKLGMDFCWFGSAKNKMGFNIPYKMTGWVKNKASEKPENIVDGYELDGTPKSTWNTSCFIGSFGMGSMCSRDYQSWCNSLYERLRSFPDSCEKCYYCGTLRLVSLMFMSGNMPDIIGRK